MQSYKDSAKAKIDSNDPNAECFKTVFDLASDTIQLAVGYQGSLTGNILEDAVKASDAEKFVNIIQEEFNKCNV